MEAARLTAATKRLEKKAQQDAAAEDASEPPNKKGKGKGRGRAKAKAKASSNEEGEQQQPAPAESEGLADEDAKPKGVMSWESVEPLLNKL